MFVDRVFVCRRHDKTFEVDVNDVWDGKFFLAVFVMQNGVFPLFGISHGLWRVCGAVGDVIVESALITEAVETIGAYVGFSDVFGPSGHESGEAFDESVMVGFFVRQKE